MRNVDIPLHIRGESVFLDDIPEPKGMLYAALFASPESHGHVRNLDVSEARKSPGVFAVLTHEDVPGQNQIGGIIQDEPLLASDEVSFIGDPLALVLAESKAKAKLAFKKIKLDIEKLEPVTDPREAFRQGRLVAPPRTFALGDTEGAWADCEVVVEGRADSGGQEHFYMETQGTLAIPLEDGGLKVYSSTQAPSAVQRTIAGVLGIAMHRVEVDVRRLGGGFGGKEDQATPWACLAALAAFKTGRPVKLVLDRHEDMTYTGKRHPYTSDFKIGLNKEGRILAYQVTFYQDSGAAADLSTAILERTLFHCTNGYYVPNVKATAACCYTNFPPFTAFRGFGGPQGMFAVESAIRAAALKLGMPAAEIQRKNLLEEKDSFPYGMPVENCRMRRSWDELYQRREVEGLFKEAETFNKQNKLEKKGVSLMPVCFGISFTNTALNQAGALVHVYTDGSVNVSTGAVEMGQGVNIKIRAIVARTFSIDEDRVKVETTNTGRVANASPTAASTGADMNGKAAQLAARQILARLRETAAELLNHPDPMDIDIENERVTCKGKQTDLGWEKLVDDAYWRRTNLSAHGFYATPNLFFDREKEKGRPFAYHVYGTAVTRVTLDCLRGTYVIDAVHIVHDAGKSLDVLIDRGQAEGGLLQGIGWMTMEELIYDTRARLLTDSAATYKVPDIKSAPAEITVHFLEDADNPHAVMHSKAIGEPPFMYGIGAYFALLDAMRAFRPEKPPVFHAPMTPEKVFMYLND